MAETKTDKSVARVETHTKAKIGAAERHNERKNEDYGNVNVVPERIPMNVHFKDPGEKSYMDILREKEESGELSERGLKADAVIFDEVVFDVNTLYFEKNGGYEYAKQFFEEAYRFACTKFGEQNIISAVMHADEINKAATADLGHDVYHYHMHLMAFPVVDKEVLWSKRCKDPALVGTVKEVVHQISHSKKWESKTQEIDDNGEPVYRKNGKPKWRPSYSVLQDEFFDHMIEHGYEGFQRGDRGSTTEHLTTLQYQIEKDTERLADIDKKIKAAEVKYEPAKEIFKTYTDIDSAGKKNVLTGNYSVPKKDYEELTALAKEGISSRGEINKLKNDADFYRDRMYRYSNSLDRLQAQYDRLVEICQPFLDALEHFPDFVHKFLDKVRDLFISKESAERAERERIRAEEEKARLERKAKNKGRDNAR